MVSYYMDLTLAYSFTVDKLCLLLCLKVFIFSVVLFKKLPPLHVATLLQIWSHLLKKSLMENFPFSAVWSKYHKINCLE